MITYIIIVLLALFCAYEFLPIKVLDFGNKIAIKVAYIYESFDQKINFDKEVNENKVNLFDKLLTKIFNSITLSKTRVKKVRFKKISHWLFRSVFLFIAFLIIIFWDIFWHLVLKHFFNFIKSLKVYDKFSFYIKVKANKYFILFIFISLFIIMEFFGIYTAVLITSGNIFLAILFYIAKFAMVFPVKVLYQEGHDKLVEIPWFLRRKNLLLSFLEWFEKTSSFKKARDILSLLRSKIKELVFKIKLILKKLKKKFRKEKEYRFIFEFKAYKRLLRMKKLERIMINKTFILFNSSSKLIKYASIISLVLCILVFMYIYLDPEYKELMNAFILRVLIFSKIQLLYIFKLINKEVLTFFWGVIIMQFWYGFVIAGIKKFVFMSLSSKLILLLISLGKRYLIDNVLMISLNNNFLIHIKRPLSKLSRHYISLLKSFSLKKRIIILASAIGIPLIVISPVLYFVGILTFILEKLFSANMWKAILLWFLKLFAIFLSFFSNIWDSWFSPLLEVILFTWILAILEKIPFIGKLIKPIYIYFNKIIIRIRVFLNLHFHYKINKGFKKAILKINYHVDITILKSQNQKLLSKLNSKKRKTIQKYVKNTMKNEKEYTYNKRLNAYLVNYRF